MRGMTPRSHGQFWAGFAAAILAVAVLGAGIQVVQWFAANPQPQTTIAWATAERWSVADVVGGLLVFAPLVVTAQFINQV